MRERYIENWYQMNVDILRAATAIESIIDNPVRSEDCRSKISYQNDGIEFIVIVRRLRWGCLINGLKS